MMINGDQGDCIPSGHLLHGEAAKPIWPMDAHGLSSMI